MDRQFCRKCLRNFVPAVTVTRTWTFPGTLYEEPVTTSLHWCAVCVTDAEQYRGGAAS